MDTIYPHRIGVYYVAMGAKAHAEARRSITSLRDHHPHIPVVVVTDGPMIRRTFRILAPDGIDPGGRLAKLSLLDLAPASWDYLLYIDADTRVRGKLDAGFHALHDGWDVAMCHSAHQGSQLFWHINWREKDLTCDEIGFEPVQMQAGLMFVRRCDETRKLFAIWREEWRRHEDKDQAALIRALNRTPVRLWMLGRPFNGGSIVSHHFGQARGANTHAPVQTP